MTNATTNNGRGRQLIGVMRAVLVIQLFLLSFLLLDKSNNNNLAQGYTTTTSVLRPPSPAASLSSWQRQLLPTHKRQQSAPHHHHHHHHHRYLSSRNHNFHHQQVQEDKTSGATSSTSLFSSTTRLGASRSSSSQRSGIFSKLPFVDKETSKSLISAAAFIFIDIAFSRAFARYKISFPPALAGCGCLFALMLVMSQKTAESLYKKLQPGADLLAKWLPVMFVPSLVTLPLAPKGLISSNAELIKAGLAIIGGLLFTLLTTAFSVTAVRNLLSSSDDDGEDDVINNNDASVGINQIDDPVVAMSVRAVKYAEKNKAPPPSKGFSRTLFRNLLTLSIGSGIGTILASKVSKLGFLSKQLSSLFMLSATLTSFVFGSRSVPNSVKKVIHPLVTCTGVTWAAIAGLATLTGSTFLSVLKTYRTGSLCPLWSTGAGDILLHLLGPAVVSLAVSMYSRRKLMKDNMPEIVTAIGVSTFGGVFGTALAVRLLGIASPILRLSLLSRNITSPLAMAIASILGADPGLAVSIVVVTGLFGANFGASILDAFGVKDPVARGLGVGAAAHGLGTAAFANEENAFPFAAIAMALTASAATVTVSIPYLRKAVLQLALG